VFMVTESSGRCPSPPVLGDEGYALAYGVAGRADVHPRPSTRTRRGDAAQAEDGLDELGALGADEAAYAQDLALGRSKLTSRKERGLAELKDRTRA